MYLSKVIIEEMFHFVARCVAEKLKISEADRKPTTELLNDIRLTDKSFYDIVDNYFRAYKKYTQFHENIEKQDKSGKLSDTEKSELVELSSALEEDRDTLSHKINGLI